MVRPNIVIALILILLVVCFSAIALCISKALASRAAVYDGYASSEESGQHIHFSQPSKPHAVVVHHGETDVSADSRDES